MKWLTSLLSFASGPLGWISAAFDWCLAHWKLVLSVIAIATVLGYTFVKGAQHERAKWEKKEAARLLMEAIVVAEHEKLVTDLEDETKKITKQRDVAEAARADLYKKIGKGVNDYVANHSQPSAPGACPTDTDIGDDGLQLIESARAARVLRGSPGAGQGSAGVQGPGAAEKP